MTVGVSHEAALAGRRRRGRRPPGAVRSNHDDRTSRGDRLGAAGRRRPRAVGGHSRRGRPPALEDRADRQRELHLRGGDGGAGLAAHQQVRRGPARQALLRRLRVRGRRRAAGPGARPGPLPRRRARQRPAPLGRPGQHGGLPRRAPARRPDPGHEPGPRRPPDPRLAGQLQRQVVRGPRLRRRPDDRADRLRRAREAGGRGPAEADRRRRQRLPAHHRLRAPRQRSPTASARCSWWTWPTSPGSSRPGLHPTPVRPRRHRHDHDPQDPARPARRPRSSAGEELGQGRRQERLPRHPGRPAHARDRRQGGGPQARRHRRVPRRPAPDDRERAGSWPRRSPSRAPASSPAARTTTSCWST